MDMGKQIGRRGGTRKGRRRIRDIWHMPAALTGRIWDAIFIAAASLCAWTYLREVLEGYIRMRVSLSYIARGISVAIFVHMIKALRTYVLLFGNRSRMTGYIHLYARTTFVNLLLPYKIGEIYRGYRLGKFLSSPVQGYMVMLADRFVDTLALMTIVVASALTAGVEMTLSYGVFMLFLGLLILAYHAFPPLSQFWGHLLIYNKSSENTLRALRFLQMGEKAYLHIDRIFRGRFLILYLLSLLAWGIEIGGLLMIGEMFSSVRLGRYLSDVMAGHMNMDNLFYMLACLLLSVAVDGVSCITARVRRRKG